MTATNFVILATICSAVATLLTEAIKKFFENAGKQSYSANLIALIDAAVVGCAGTAISYVLMEIPFTIQNILCLVLMTFAVWVGSMIGYDKVLQLIKQVTEGKKDN